MARRKPKNVTLARFERWDSVSQTVIRDRDAERAAEDAEPKRATPERIAKAYDDAIGVDRVQRLADPFDVLRARGRLAPNDPELNDLLWHAGTRYREHWHGAGLDGAQAMDLTRDIVDGGAGVAGLPDHVAQHASELRAAHKAIGLRCGPFVVGVVVEGQSIAKLAGMVVETRHVRTGKALATDRLIEGLHRLVELWGMKPKAGKSRTWRSFSHQWNDTEVETA